MLNIIRKCSNRGKKCKESLKKVTEIIKRRDYKQKNRIYVEAQYLEEYGFKKGTPIKYAVDMQNKRITIVPIKKSLNHVATTTQARGKTPKEVPVIDIKNKADITEFFKLYNDVEIQISQRQIILTVKSLSNISSNHYLTVEQELVTSREAEKSKQTSYGKVLNFRSAKVKKAAVSKKHYAVNIKDLAKASGYEQMSIYDFFTAESEDVASSRQNLEISKPLKEKSIKTLSLFSGCGSFDKGFVDQGFEIVFANDRFEKKALRDYHIQTYKHNISNHIVMRDVMELTEKDIPEVDFVIAGVPCVTFSALNTKNNFRDSDSLYHPIVEQTLNIIKWSKAKSFLIENVERFLSVKDGAMLKRIKERLADFGIVARIIKGTDVGSAQKRKRAFIFGIQGGNPHLELPPVAEYRTVADAWKDIENAPQQDIYFTTTEKIRERIKYIPQGGNIKWVPEHLRASGKRFSNYCQRLIYNGQAPTITHVQDEAFLHPLLDTRFITVREAARLFSLPDNFIFIGSRTAIFKMIKNCVDYRKSTYLAKTIKEQLLPILFGELGALV
ncbi:DNA cytosine methyltransferase [Priestia aryabhattai]|uniref:Cytosine-specific methyltransferase n=1 Tax=Priestia aryabhattai TaxID=412384 RepID=A0AAX6ND02_PRIAR|nr:DNA cytosine methyltransferase [Priestia aryabhattai]MDU9693374.1 DNA cytosine methyltransferase [Priestia aryabhattai]